MALIEFNPDFHALVAVAERIARALEEIVLRQYGVPLRPTPPPDRDESAISYMDDQGAWRQELVDLDRRRNPESVIDGTEG